MGTFVSLSAVKLSTYLAATGGLDSDPRQGTPGGGHSESWLSKTL